MAIQDAGDDVRTVEAGFCTECGAQLAGGRFCAHCGHPVGGAAPFARYDAATQRGEAAAYEATELQDAPPYAAPYANGNGAAPPATAQAPPRRRRWPIVVGIVVVLLALAGAGVAIFLTSQGSEAKGDPVGEYRTKVAETLAPVNDANQRVSESFADLRGDRRAIKQRDAVAAAQDATSSARGALGAIPVPDDGEQIAQQARQALVREQTYLKAVSVALVRPTDPGLSELQPLAGNLTSALEAVDAPIGSAAQNVRGVEKVTRWAMRRREILEAQGIETTTTTTPAPTTTAPAVDPGAIDNPCGGGTFVNDTTTCPFAENVRDTWSETPGIENTFTAYSAATGRDITMTCNQTGGQIVCTGGTNARVAWDW